MTTAEIRYSTLSSTLTLAEAIDSLYRRPGESKNAVTQRLAAQAGVSQSCINYLLREDHDGHTSMHEETADAIVDVIGLHTSDISWPLDFDTKGGLPHAHPKTDKLEIVDRPRCPVPGHNVELSASGECYFC